MERNSNDYFVTIEPNPADLILLHREKRMDGTDLCRLDVSRPLSILMQAHATSLSHFLGVVGQGIFENHGKYGRTRKWKKEIRIHNPETIRRHRMASAVVDYEFIS